MKFEYKEVEEHFVIYKIGSKFLFNTNSVVIDCGACIGGFTDKLLQYNCKFYLYEPHPRLYRKLRNKYSKYNNVFVYDYAIDTTTNNKDFYIGAYNTSSSLYSSHRGMSGNKIQVKTIDINEVLSKFERIDLIKFDIEGSEVDIIPNISPKLLEKINQIIVEYHLQAKINGYTRDKVDMCRKYIKQNGFEEVIYNEDLSSNRGQDATYINKRLL